MYKLLYFLIIKKTLSTGKIFIMNKELPICFKCLHFIEHTNNYPYDPIPCDEKYGRCQKFGEVNLITGAIQYDLASNCRLNDSKFGSEYTEKVKS
jgi:hypothetical protein